MLINPIGEVYVIPRPRGGGESSAEGWRLRFLYSFFTTSPGRASPSIRWHDDVSQILGNCTCRQWEKGWRFTLLAGKWLGGPLQHLYPEVADLSPNYKGPKTSRHRWCLGMEEILVIHQGLGQFLWAYFQSRRFTWRFLGPSIELPTDFCHLDEWVLNQPPTQNAYTSRRIPPEVFQRCLISSFFGGPTIPNLLSKCFFDA